MSLVSLSPTAKAYAVAAYNARLRRAARLRRMASQAPMGSWLSEWIKKRKKKGIDLNMKVGKGNLAYSVPATTDPATGLPVKAGPIEWAKRNPAIVAGVGGGLLITTMLILKRKKKGGRK